MARQQAEPLRRDNHLMRYGGEQFTIGLSERNVPRCGQTAALRRNDASAVASGDPGKIIGRGGAQDK